MAWEYKIAALEKQDIRGDWMEGMDAHLSVWLNEQGQDGWELAVIGGNWRTCIFKRQCFPATEEVTND